MPIPLHNSLQGKILSTLVYFDIFDFPLTKEETTFFLHTSHKKSEKDIEQYLSKVPHTYFHGRTFYFLPKRESIVQKRIMNEDISLAKLKNVKKTIRLLQFIPTVAFLGISGSIAMKNGNEESDIDLFVISLPHTVWITRFVVWVVLSLFGKRRKRNTKGENLICINMIVDRDKLGFPRARHDIYTAHEIVQVVPIINRFHTYELFLHANEWVLYYLANSNKKIFSHKGLPLILRFFCVCLLPIELLLFSLQLLYMKKHKTIEQTTLTFIAFHPFNYRDTIVKEFEKRKKEYAV